MRVLNKNLCVRQKQLQLTVAINENTPKTTVFNNEIYMYPTKRERISKCQKSICF